MNRNALAATGLARAVLNTCSRATPVMPTGIVAITISHARRSSWPLAVKRRSETLLPTLRKNPVTMRIQSARKNHSSASAVATCSATRNAR